MIENGNSTKWEFLFQILTIALLQWDPILSREYCISLCLILYLEFIQADHVFYIGIVSVANFFCRFWKDPWNIFDTAQWRRY